ncbi:MAG: hypothetical protein ACE5Z5_10395 [Candidatus Bathyarchaeia archaeon]
MITSFLFMALITSTAPSTANRWVISSLKGNRSLFLSRMDTDVANCIGG